VKKHRKRVSPPIADVAPVSLMPPGRPAPQDLRGVRCSHTWPRCTRQRNSLVAAHRTLHLSHRTLHVSHRGARGMPNMKFSQAAWHLARSSCAAVNGRQAQELHRGASLLARMRHAWRHVNCAYVNCACVSDLGRVLLPYFL